MDPVLRFAAKYIRGSEGPLAIIKEVFATFKTVATSSSLCAASNAPIVDQLKTEPSSVFSIQISGAQSEPGDWVAFRLKCANLNQQRIGHCSMAEPALDTPTQFTFFDVPVQHHESLDFPDSVLKRLNEYRQQLSAGSDDQNIESESTRLNTTLRRHKIVTAMESI